ncbi:TonB-dependent receptor [Vibrio sinaloensis]|nr:TonB-dependent receptor [Vibrio sinaloensis]
MFFQDEMTFLDGDLTVTPGIRYDHFSTDPGKVESEELKKSFLIQHLRAAWVLIMPLRKNHSVFFGQVSQGFRAPSFDELFYTYDNPAHRYYNEPNPDLKI